MYFVSIALLFANAWTELNNLRLFLGVCKDTGDLLYKFS